MPPSDAEKADASRAPPGDQARRREALLLPNLVTYVRLAAIPAFAWAFLTGRPVLASALFAAAALTDGIDGLLARTLDQTSALGAALDPIADKLLTLVALALLAFAGELPAWLFVFVGVKEVGTVAGAAVLQARGHGVPTPRRLGKYATFALALTVWLALLARTGVPAARPFVVSSALLAVGCAAAAAVQYSARWTRLLRPRPTPLRRSAPPPSPPRLRSP